MEGDHETRKRKEKPPQLLILHGSLKSKQTLYDLEERRYSKTSIPIMCNKSVLPSGFGWLAIIDSTHDDCCLWNPKSSETVPLPTLPDYYLYNQCVLSGPPTEPGSYIIFNFSGGGTQSFCRIRVDDSFVTRVEEAFDGNVAEEEDKVEFVKRCLEAGMYRVNAVVSFEGTIYGVVETVLGHTVVTVGLDSDGNLDVRPVLTEEGGFLSVPQPWSDRVTRERYWLIESPCGKDLLLVSKMFMGHHYNNGFEFMVFRVDLNRKECFQVEDLGDVAIFIDVYGGGFCRSISPLENGVRPNSIYYTERMGRCLYAHDLSYRSTTTLLTCDHERRKRKEKPPQLLILHGSLKSKQTLYDVEERRYRKTSIPIMCNKSVLPSGFGWLAIMDSTHDHCCLWNPKSSETVSLPMLPNYYLYDQCVLSGPPIEPGSYIIFNSSSYSTESFCRIGVDGSFATRVEEELDDDVAEEDDEDEFVKRCLEAGMYSVNAMASFEGTIYGIVETVGHTLVTFGLDSDGNLHVRPVLTEEGGFLSVPHHWSDRVTRKHYWLIEPPRGKEELLLVIKMFTGHHAYNGFEFKVFRVDLSRKECLEVEDLGDVAIFIDAYGRGFCRSINPGVRPNSIYYTEGMGQCLYAHDLSYGSTTTLLTCPAAGRYVATSLWVEESLFDQWFIK
ncbi:hypothetical protein STAS_26395 [Striga asiatica]|uniref:KIB1-4 beta-propeller domain-containing protein n=1 Tax=Striga asiatica TaxID=4170 RepID=A0A5A7QW17_STRAF|nr:hypothetical protein STAS_26395 [Striga asiatica]